MVCNAEPEFYRRRFNRCAHFLTAVRTLRRKLTPHPDREEHPMLFRSSLLALLLLAALRLPAQQAASSMQQVASSAQQQSSVEQTAEEQVRAVVILARHGVRTPIESETRSGVFNAQPWPAWPTEPGLLTPHGIEALKRMGEFYRQRYATLLEGCSSVRVESTNVPRTIASAKAVLSVIAPSCNVEIAPDLAADPPGIDKAKLAAAISGRMAAQPQWFTNSFARPLAGMHDVLTSCTGCKAVPDFRTMMLAMSTQAPGMMQPGASSTSHAVVPRDPARENAVALGADFAENFLLQYTEGLAMNQVGWGRVSRAKLDELMEMNTRYHDFILRTPYYAREAAGPLAQKISSYLRDAAKDDAASHLLYLSAHDANITWLGGLLRIDWIVRDETINATPPGSALVFELVHNRQTQTDTVRAFFIAQTLNQIRNLTPLTGEEEPSIAPIFVPGCSGPGPEYACTLEDFAQVVKEAAHAR
jgi:4-phytase/acid phosphatase